MHPRAKTLNEADSVEEQLSAGDNQQVPSLQASNANTCIQVLYIYINIYTCAGLILTENSPDKVLRRTRLLISSFTRSKKAAIKPQEYFSLFLLCVVQWHRSWPTGCAKDLAETKAWGNISGSPGKWWDPRCFA